jgi:hypothetical protein
MRQSRTSGSVGGRGGQPPRSTRLGVAEAAVELAVDVQADLVAFAHRRDVGPDAQKLGSLRVSREGLKRSA